MLSTDVSEYLKPINFTPSPEDAKRLALLHELTSLRGASIVRRALRALERQELAVHLAVKKGVVRP